jgi:molybdopterin synthase catalytic subunit
MERPRLVRGGQAARIRNARPDPSPMADITDAVNGRYELCEVAIAHRVGRCDVGEISVAIAVSAPHRQDALSACRDVIDELKERVPLWKKELYEGGEEWIGRGS